MMDFSYLERIVADERAIIYVRDADGRYVWVNDRFDTDLPVTREAVMGKTNAEIFGAEAARAWDIADGLSRAVNSFVITPEDLYDQTSRRWRKFLSLKIPLRMQRGLFLVGVSVELVDASAIEYEKKLAGFRARLIGDLEGG